VSDCRQRGTTVTAEWRERTCLQWTVSGWSFVSTVMVSGTRSGWRVRVIDGVLTDRLCGFSVVAHWPTSTHIPLFTSIMLSDSRSSSIRWFAVSLPSSLRPRQQMRNQQNTTNRLQYSTVVTLLVVFFLTPESRTSRNFQRILKDEVTNSRYNVDPLNRCKSQSHT